MRKIIGVGETILDIIFEQNQPKRAVPGGSTFNCMISLGRRALPVLFVSELGNDRVGRLIRDFMTENSLSSDYVDFFEEGSSPVSLAFLDEKQNAQYQFFKNFPKERLNISFPEINPGDILIFGSYFAVNPLLHDRISDLLQYAKAQKAIIYYDINFRPAHAKEKEQLMPAFLENFACSSIIRCSDEDLDTLFPGESIEAIYQNRIAPYCRNFIVTKGEKGVWLKTAQFEKEYAVEPIVPVSTIGAGDNFNAGLIYGMMKGNIGRDDLDLLEENVWDDLIDSAKAFATEVCLSYDNYVSK